MVQAHSEKAGQWCKSKTIETQERQIGYIFFGCTIFAAITAFLAGLSFNHWWITTGLLVCLVPAILFKGRLLRIIDSLFQHWSKQRLRYLRGGQAQAWVSLQFRDALNDQWHLFDNLMLDQNSDIDHILIGPGGFFVISTKSQRGLFCTTPGQSDEATFNLKPCKWTSEATLQTMRLKDKIAVVEPAKQPWIQTVLALPFAHIDAPPARDSTGQPVPNAAAVGKCWVLHEDTLLEAIAPDSVPKSRKLSKAEVTRWVAAVEKLKR